MRIAIANDHGGLEMKLDILDTLKKYPNIFVADCGTDSFESVDYPTYAEKVCKRVLSGESQRGILVCGTGIGMSMVANRFKGIRAALCHDVHTARMSRQHNNSNVLVLGGRTPLYTLVPEIISCWLEEEFDTRTYRHVRRVGMIDAVSCN